MQRLTPLLAGLIASIALVACGGGSSSKTTPTAAPQSTASPAIARPADATRAPVEETAVATHYDMEVHQHDATPYRQGTDVIDFPFQISLPKGWAVTGAGIPVTATLLRPDTQFAAFASIGIDCRPNVDYQAMLKKDSDVADLYKFGDLGAVEKKQVTVGGRDAIRADWAGSGTFRASHVSVYVNGKSCTWRIQLNVYGALTPNDFIVPFQRVLDSFDPAQGMPGEN